MRSWSVASAPCESAGPRRPGTRSLREADPLAARAGPAHDGLELRRGGRVVVMVLEDAPATVLGPALDGSEVAEEVPPALLPGLQVAAVDLPQPRARAGREQQPGERLVVLGVPDPHHVLAALVGDQLEAELVGHLLAVLNPLHGLGQRPLFQVAEDLVHAPPG